MNLTFEKPDSFSFEPSGFIEKIKNILAYIWSVLKS